jgi:hypothetical protein
LRLHDFELAPRAGDQTKPLAGVLAGNASVSTIRNDGRRGAKPSLPRTADGAVLMVKTRMKPHFQENSNQITTWPCMANS